MSTTNDKIQTDFKTLKKNEKYLLTIINIIKGNKFKKNEMKIFCGIKKSICTNFQTFL